MHLLRTECEIAHIYSGVSKVWVFPDFSLPGNATFLIKL